MIIKLSDCKAPITPVNDNGHTEWQDWFHVKPWATDSLYDVYLTGKPLPKVAIMEVVK